MMIEATMDQSDVNALSEHVQDQIEFAAMRVQAAMAAAYVDVIASNLGSWGIDRPLPWAPLSPGYAKKVGRKFATLYETGAMARAVKTDNSKAYASEVSISEGDCPYALAHQFGYPPHNLPARPYFPFDPTTGETTPYTLGLMREVAQEELAAALAEDNL